jgi:hypothetical protein
VHGGVDDDPGHQEAREIRHESLLDDLVDSTVGLIVDTKGIAVEENVAAAGQTEPGSGNLRDFRGKPASS